MVGRVVGVIWNWVHDSQIGGDAEEGHARRKIRVGFTPRERLLVLDQTLAGPELTNALREAPPVDGRHVASFTLSDLDELLEYVAAEANHSTDGKIRRELDALYGRLGREMESYDDGMWQETF